MRYFNIYNHALLVVLGHYGSGKTNFVLNCAVHMHKAGRMPTVVDLDVVNPYFRSTDFSQDANLEGITMTGPVFGKSNLDAPSLAPGIDALISRATLEKPVILDVGGDPDGARALARYTPAIQKVPDALVVMIANTRRPETQHVAENMTMLEDLSLQAGLVIDAIIGNTHIAQFTTLATIGESLPVLTELAAVSGIPLAAVTVPLDVLTEGEDHPETEHEGGLSGKRDKDTKIDSFLDKRDFEVIPVERLVKTTWQ